MPATKVTLTGGAFQDSEGNLLANGYLEFVLNQDVSITGVGNIVAGITVKVQLDANGNVQAAPAQQVWGNDQMLPVNSYYRVTGFTAAGQPAWGPNNQQVNGSGVSFDLGTWIPNRVISWTPALTATLLEVDGVANAVQTILNLISSATAPTVLGGNIQFVDQGNGSVKAVGPGFQTNGVTNLSQADLNLTDGTGIHITNPSGTGVVVAATSGQPTGGTAGQVLTKNSSTNYDSSWVTPSAGGGGLPDPYTQWSLWWPDGAASDNQFFTPSSVWGTRVLNKNQTTAFYTPLDAVGVWTTPVAILTSQGSPDNLMGYTSNFLVNNATTSKIQLGGTSWIYPGRVGKFKTAVTPLTGVLNFRYWTGLFDQFADVSVLEPATAASAVAGAMFFFNHADSANIQCFTSDRTGVFNLVDSGVAFNVGTVYKLEIDWNGAGTYTFIINGATVATISTHTPTVALGSNLSMVYALGSNGGGTGQGTRIAMLYGENSY